MLRPSELDSPPSGGGQHAERPRLHLPVSEEERERLALGLFRLQVHHTHQCRGENDPRELVPVEERKSPSRGCVVGVKRRKAQTQVRQRKQPDRATSFSDCSLLWLRGHAAKDNRFGVIREVGT